MKNLVFMATIFTGALLLTGCGQTAKSPEKMKNLVVINVLDKDTYEDCHILGSINIPFESIETAMDTIEKDAEVVFYCSNPMCSASEYAALQFQKAGFSNVAVYEGGTAEWYQKGLPVEGVSCAAYLREPVTSVDTEGHAVKALSIDELAGKMGYEVPNMAAATDENALQNMSDHVAQPVEI